VPIYVRGESSEIIGIKWNTPYQKKKKKKKKKGKKRRNERILRERSQKPDVDIDCNSVWIEFIWTRYH
jgi:hypothetical protein